MATYVYGNLDYPSGYLFRFRAWFAYTTSSTDTTYSVTVFAGPQLYDNTGAVGMTLTCRLTGTGQTSRSATKKFSTNSDDSSARMTFLSSKKWTWTKGTSSSSKTITCSLSGNGVSSSASKTFTVPALASYSITYNNNSGSGSISSQTKYYGKSITLSSGSGFTRSGYTLKGWNTAADGSGTSYELGQTYTSNKALTLYAQWSTDYAITDVKARRVDEDGNDLPRSEYLNMSFNYNTLSTTGVAYSITIDGNTIESGSLSSTTGTIEHFSTDETYSLDETHSIVINVGGITKTITVPIAVRPIDIMGNGNDISMGIMSPADPDYPLMLTPKCSISSDGVVNTTGSYTMSGSKLLKVYNTVKDNVSIAKATTGNGSFTITAQSGYTPVGVVGIDLSNASSSGANVGVCSIIQFQLTGSTFYWQIRNNHSSSAAKIMIQVFVLYAKTGLI